MSQWSYNFKKCFYGKIWIFIGAVFTIFGIIVNIINGGPSILDKILMSAGGAICGIALTLILDVLISIIYGFIITAKTKY